MKRIGAAAAWLLALTQMAGAVVGGADETGPAGGQAAMILNSQGGMCSAVVLAPDALLTAAHCVAGRPQHRAYVKGADGSPVLIEPTAKALHPAYDPGAVAGRRRSIDLALVRLAEPLPARFAPALLAVAAPAKGSGVAVAGYGRAREGDIRSNGVFRSATLAVSEPYGPSRILLWAEGRDSGACEGDSGGPLLVEGAVAAVTTWAKGEGSRACGRITQGVLVGPQRAWIDGVLKGWGREARWRE